MSSSSALFRSAQANGPSLQSAMLTSAEAHAVSHMSSVDGGYLDKYTSKANQTFNSLDFDDVENELLVESRKANPDQHRTSILKKWLAIVLIGVLTAFIAYGIDQGIQYLMKWKFMAVTHFMATPQTVSQVPDPNDKTGTKTISVWTTAEIPFAQPFFLYIALNLALVSVAAGLVVFVEPVARGSGISEIKCFLNGIRIFRVVRFRTLMVKAVGILFSVASGLPCGKEGPMIHSGAAIASGIVTGKSSMFHFDSGFFREFRQDKVKRSFITAGAAAGVGAAFGAPVGGLLFAVEEVGSFWSLDYTVKVFVCAAITPWVLQLLMYPDAASHAQIRGLIDFGRVNGEYNYTEIPFVIILGVLGGLIGAAFVGLNIVLTKWRQKWVKTKRARFIEALAVNALTSTVLILLVLRGYTCTSDAGVVETMRNKLQRYGCNPGEYNDMATYFFRSMEDSISVLFHSESEIALRTLAMQFVPYFFLTVITYGVYVPSGLFLPTLALGASFGHFYAQVWNSALGGHFTLDPARFAVYGGTAVLGGTVRMTISIIVIVMEATGNTNLFYPLCMITIAAKVVGDKFTHSIYEAHIVLNNVPLLATRLDPEYEALNAEQVMNQDFVPLPRVCKVAYLKTVLRATPFHNALVIIDPTTHKLSGLLLRRNAVILIAKNAHLSRLALHDFIEGKREREFFRVKKYGLLEDHAEDHERFIDLQPYMDQWPHTVTASTPLTRVFKIFRELGLRHILVLDSEGRPIGLIARKQLCYLQKDSCQEADYGPEAIPVETVGSPASPLAGVDLYLSTRSVERQPVTQHRVLTHNEIYASFQRRLADTNADWVEPHIENVT
jgi:chloride channel 7